MTLKKIMRVSLACIALLFAVTAQAIMLNPHFYIQMENRSDKYATISFQPDVGNVYLDPTLNDNTPLVAHTSSIKYGVYIEPVLPTSTFNIVFSGVQSCTFNVGFYSEANPKITISGPGCVGGGYEILDNGSMLVLFISDIN